MNDNELGDDRFLSFLSVNTPYCPLNNTGSNLHIFSRLSKYLMVNMLSFGVKRKLNTEISNMVLDLFAGKYFKEEGPINLHYLPDLFAATFELPPQTPSVGFASLLWHIRLQSNLLLPQFRYHVDYNKVSGLH